MLTVLPGPRVFRERERAVGEMEKAAEKRVREKEEAEAAKISVRLHMQGAVRVWGEHVMAESSR